MLIVTLIIALYCLTEEQLCIYISWFQQIMFCFTDNVWREKKNTETYLYTIHTAAQVSAFSSVRTRENGKMLPYTVKAWW